MLRYPSGLVETESQDCNVAEVDQSRDKFWGLPGGVEGQVEFGRGVEFFSAPVTAFKVELRPRRVGRARGAGDGQHEKRNERRSEPEHEGSTDFDIHNRHLEWVRINVYAFLQRAVKDHRDQENPQVAGLGLAHDLQAFKQWGSRSVMCRVYTSSSVPGARARIVRINAERKALPQMRFFLSHVFPQPARDLIRRAGGGVLHPVV